MASSQRSPLLLPVDWTARMAEAQALAAAGGELSRRIGVAALAGFARAAAASPAVAPMARFAPRPAQEPEAPRFFSRRMAELARKRVQAA
ncbi:hypothetical protein [Neomegalonema sp.]|uniref:hypothetical protein n=1 Tax=Neomegalonema sp. TaxID=2039713 RepID=UPI00263455C9|nr:hypothetical protein [Neomegalonema sp.]MDD2867612.1 hypothetical protein [Neomegalonema sp.]